jgi:hypothetical protein
MNVESAITAANNNGYAVYSGIDTSNYTASSDTSVDAINYSGLVTSLTGTQTNATLNFQPYTTTNDLIPSVKTSATIASSASLQSVIGDNDLSSVSGSSQASAAAATIDSVQSVSSPTSNLITALDFGAAALKLSASHGVYYDNTKTESLIKTPVANLIGSQYDTVHVGNLDYIIAKFSDSYISTGSGRNTVKIGSTENNNYFKLGDGNNKVTLDGNGNSILFGDGANYLEVNGSTGKNYIVAGNGPETVKINGTSGFTQISNWDNTQDYLTFGEGINLSDVSLKFNHENWSYDVFVADKLITNVITSGGLTYADANSIVKHVAYSAPLPYNIQSNTGFLNALYADAFDAQPDAAGFTFWTNQLNSGASRTSVIKAFLTSPQFNAEHPTNALYVDAVYQDLLGRPAEAAGLNFWTNALNKGLPESSFVVSVLHSSEFSSLVGGVYN